MTTHKDHEPMHADRKQRAPTDPVCSRGTGHEGDCNGAWRWDCPPGMAQKAREAAAYSEAELAGKVPRLPEDIARGQANTDAVGRGEAMPRPYEAGVCQGCGTRGHHNPTCPLYGNPGRLGPRCAAVNRVGGRRCFLEAGHHEACAYDSRGIHEHEVASPAVEREPKPKSVWRWRLSNLRDDGANRTVLGVSTEKIVILQGGRNRLLSEFLTEHEWVSDPQPESPDARSLEQGEEPNEAVLQWGDATCHDGAGWYYWDAEYQDEGSVGAFPTRRETETHAREAGYNKFSLKGDRISASTHIAVEPERFGPPDGALAVDCDHVARPLEPNDTGVIRADEGVVLEPGDADTIRRVVRSFASLILHGDAEHRAWLLDAAERYIAGKPIPAVRRVQEQAPQAEAENWQEQCGAEYPGKGGGSWACVFKRRHSGEHRDTNGSWPVTAPQAEAAGELYVPSVGERVRVLEVAARDRSAALHVGAEGTVREVCQGFRDFWNESYTLITFMGGPELGTWCRVEPITEPIPPATPRSEPNDIWPYNRINECERARDEALANFNDECSAHHATTLRLEARITDLDNCEKLAHVYLGQRDEALAKVAAFEVHFVEEEKAEYDVRTLRFAALNLRKDARWHVAQEEMRLRGHVCPACVSEKEERDAKKTP